jgi:hypothetical protein
MKHILFLFSLLLISCNQNSKEASSIHSCLSTSQSKIINQSHLRFKQFLKDEHDVQTIEDYKRFFKHHASIADYTIPTKYITSFDEFKESQLVDTVHTIDEIIMSEDNLPLKQKIVIDLKWSKDLIRCIKTASISSINVSTRENFTSRLIKNNNFSSAIVSSSMHENFDNIDFNDDVVMLWVLVEFYIEPCVRQSIETKN